MAEYGLRLFGIFACGMIFQACYLWRKDVHIDIIECFLSGAGWMMIALLIAEYT